MVKIAIIGYGKMGQIIERLAMEKGHEIVAVIDPYFKTSSPGNSAINNQSNSSTPKVEKEISKKTLKDAEVCIEFTTPQAAIENIKKIAECGKNIVVGTTGWYNQMEEVRKIVDKNKIGLIWSGNFSIGVNAFFRIVENAAKIFNNLNDYDVLAYELHHNQKADSPSGTAKMLGDIILKSMPRKTKAVTEKLDRKIEGNEFHLASVRGGSIPGIHEVMFDSKEDSIELKHTARNREGFASGAVIAAEFIKGKKGMYNIDDLMKKIIEK